MYEKRKEVLQEKFAIADAEILLFDDLIELKVKNFTTTALPGESSAFVE
ncbi:MAG: hypothetical protein H6765_01625 [Candidatus Peribacteria bacterium]|nr:MAG: hypothetical protein H6765_01625 [Candidatus Peribacteria bacterium]